MRAFLNCKNNALKKKTEEQKSSLVAYEKGEKLYFKSRFTSQKYCFPKRKNMEI